MLLLHIFLTPPIEVYAATNVEQNFVITNLWQLFVSSHTPLSPSLSLPLSLSLSHVWQHIHPKIKSFVYHYISMPR